MSPPEHAALPAPAGHHRRLLAKVWRLVESQFRIATRRLVDSDDEQAVLEQLIDAHKPPPPQGPGFRGLHYLLSTPFRHPPLRFGSRFGRRHERGLFYAARQLATAQAEVAYYRFVFLQGTAATLQPLVTELSAFAVRIRARRGLDLTLPPYARHGAEVSSATSYARSQELGDLMRTAGTEAFVYRSARDPEAGDCLALFTPCFATKNPSEIHGWRCTADTRRVEMSRLHVLTEERVSFARELFLVGGVLPSPAT